MQIPGCFFREAVCNRSDCICDSGIKMDGILLGIAEEMVFTGEEDPYTMWSAPRISTAVSSSTFPQGWAWLISK